MSTTELEYIPDADPLNDAFLENDDYDYLPLGAHLLPQEYRDFLASWHREMEDKIGYWLGAKKEYASKYPKEHSLYISKNMCLEILYAVEVAAVKRYQRMHAEDSD
jgi:hypothetical protein